jgi:hypothetical protein
MTDQTRDIVERLRARIVYTFGGYVWKEGALLSAEDEAEAADHIEALTKRVAELEPKLTRPIIGLENRSALEVFDIMCDRIRAALSNAARGEEG